MHRTLHSKWLYAAISFFIVVALTCVVKEFYWILALPIVLLLVLTALYRLDQLFFFTVFCTPLAINLQHLDIGIGVSLPTEPIIFGMMLVFYLKLIYDGKFDRKVLYHPLTIVILFHVFWMFLTSLTSQRVVVSLKASTAQLWFITVFYLLATQLFSSMRNIYRFLWLYMIPLLMVVIYTTVNHISRGLTEKAAHVVMVPFFNDHTAYAAALALFLPVIIAFMYNPILTVNNRILACFLTIVFIIAIILSYTRAAWVGIIVSFLTYLIFLFRIRTSYVLIGLISLSVMYFIFQTQILMRFEKNKAQSSTDYSSHVASITNIKTDASNVERINRWNSALRMFRQKPLLGWGPGTYMFEYAPFQKISEKSTISTNSGNLGNAHSEYLGPLAEQGLPGSLLFILIAVIAIVKASRLINTTADKEVRVLAIGILLGLITYFVHGTLNNFLDTDKASVPFWGFLAILTALEVYHNKKPSSQP